MALAFHGGDFDQHLFVDDGRPAQQRASNGNFVFVRELADEAARRIRQPRQPLGKISARFDFGVRDKTDQDTVEQIDMVGAEARCALQKQFADATRGVGAALGVATTDNVVEFRDQRWRNYHKPIQNRPFWRVFGQSRSRS